MLCILPCKILYKVNPTIEKDVLCNVKLEPLAMFVTLLKTLFIIIERIVVSNMKQEQSLGMTVNKNSQRWKVYARVHVYRIIHAINNNDINSSVKLGDASEKAPSLFLNDSKNVINQADGIVIDSDETDIEDNLNNDVLSSLETDNKDERKY